MAKRARLRIGSASDSDNPNDTSSELALNSNSDVESSDDSDDGASEPVRPRQRRKDLRCVSYLVYTGSADSCFQGGFTQVYSRMLRKKSRISGTRSKRTSREGTR